MAVKSRLKEEYEEKIRPALKKEIGFDNIMQVPRIVKVVLNIGMKDAVGSSKVVGAAKDIISRIAGQAACLTKAKKSIAGFKLRQGMVIGVSVTLRKLQMYHFLDKLLNIALPAVRDFQGVKRKFDGHGNYNLGIKDWMIFPEVDYDKVDVNRGLNISIQTTALTDEHGKVLLEKFNMPFKK